MGSCAGPYEARMAERKRRLLGGLTGTVLEIGPGAGPNLRHYGPGVRWIGVEPNPFMHPWLRREADRHGRPVDLRTASAERLDLPDGSVDAVVGTLVLCSVDNLASVLGEVRRVLTPAGRFVFIEHVAAEAGTALRRWQERLRRPWGFVADGCRPHQDTVGLLREAGFDVRELERFRADGLWLASPHVAGYAVMR